MIIGVPREVKQDEHRVGLVPAGAYSLVKAGHQVLVEQGAGLGSGISDANYTRVGAQIVIDRDELFAQADMIVTDHHLHPAQTAFSQAGQEFPPTALACPVSQFDGPHAAPPPHRLV